MNKKLSTLWFKYLTSHYLIYNTCWEDPHVDRFLLELTKSSNVFMITSAGDNAFDYLLDHPTSIDCVDINPYQNVLLELKIALFKHCKSEYLTELFLTGKSQYYKDIYSEIQPYLDSSSLNFWNSRIDWFSPKKGFYKQGLTGWFARFLNFLIQAKGLRSDLEQLIYEESRDLRAKIFSEKIEPSLWNGYGKDFWKSDFVLGFAGIPSTQSDSVTDLNEYMRLTIRNLFVERGIQNNYFWRLYIEGKYTSNNCPNYLKEQYFHDIQSQIEKIHFENKTVTSYLSSTDKKYSHFVLLDHQDWLIGNDCNELEKEWISLLRSAEPKAKILFRSVHKNLEFLPGFVKQSVSNIPIDGKYLLNNDRVGTYPSTYLLEVDV